MLIVKRVDDLSVKEFKVCLNPPSNNRFSFGLSSTNKTSPSTIHNIISSQSCNPASDKHIDIISLQRSSHSRVSGSALVVPGLGEGQGVQGERQSSGCS